MHLSLLIISFDAVLYAHCLYLELSNGTLISNSCHIHSKSYSMHFSKMLMLLKYCQVIYICSGLKDSLVKPACVMVNVFSNISVVSSPSLLLMEETRVPRVQLHLAMSGILTHNLVVIYTDCIGNFKSNYHTIKTRTAL